MEKRKEVGITLGLIVLLLVLMIGVSYAAFNFNGLGSKVNTITSGAISMTYTETENVISLNKALPTTDKTGKTLEDYFEFTVSSNIKGETNINYEISAKEQDGNTFARENVKLYLTKLNSDGSEEALMVPEVYSEEITSNDYTGRPANEMSLYTSNMSSSESNTYRLRMWVSEDYNPQNDGGNLTFSVKINVYGEAGDRYVPLTTQEILEANPLQEEITNMFNYTANGRQYLNNSLGDVDESYVTNGLYSLEDEDGTSYYFRGNNVNNYVQFGEYQEDYYVYRSGAKDFITLESCQAFSSCSESNRVLKYSAGTSMYWRIVRINGDGSLRLIYNGTSTSATGQDLMIGFGYYNFEPDNLYDDLKYAGYTYDRNTNETDSNAKRDIESWYKDVFTGTVYDKEIIGGRFCSDSSGYKLGTDYGLSISYSVFASYDRLGQLDSNYSKANVPTLICPDTDETYGGSYRLKVGLITADELVLSGMTFDGNDMDSSYLTSSENYWSMTPSLSNFATLAMWQGEMSLRPIGIFWPAGLRPVINVKPNNGFISGDGTATSPFILS